MNIFIILVIIAFLYVIVNHVLDMISKEEKVEAKLIKKVKETYLGAEDIPMNRYTLIFLIKCTKKSFDVSYDNYQKYEEQEEGILYHKRNKFMRFEKKDK